MAPMQPESLFSQLATAPPDEVFTLMGVFSADPFPEKVSLGAGVYRDNEARSWRLPAVRKAEERLLEDPTFDHEYLPIPGYSPFIDLSRDLVFGGADSPVEKDRIASLQTVSGTGANHIGARFLADFLPPLAQGQKRTVWISDPTWVNHHLLWDLVSSGTTGSPVERRTYPYYHAPTRTLDFDGMMSILEKEASKGDVVLLHACAHNPTGIDPTRAQWHKIADLCERKGVFPFFDSAYQGFASGDLNNDAWAIREFASRGMELCVAQSFSKNLGLYGQRVGAFHLVCRTADATQRARSQAVELQRGEISTPPAYGARLAATVLGDPELKKDWEQDLITMSSRIKSMRRALYDELKRLNTPGTWEHIINQIGMFSYTGLTKEQVRVLNERYHIYLLDSGRVSISGLNTSNVKYVAQAFDTVDSSVSNQMQIFPKSSFFKERRAPALPTPARIRAINKKLDNIRTASFNRPPPVMISSLGLFVKYGADVTIVEAQTQMMVREKLQGQVPVPEVFGWAEDGGQRFIYMSLVEGETLQERWSDMSNNERRAICKELKHLVKTWRALGQDGHDRYISSLGKQSLNDIFLACHPELTGPFQGANTIQQFQDACGIEISSDVPIIFTHDDLVPPNILLSRGPNPKVAAVIDWGQAGWYPAYWEYCKARRVRMDPEYFNDATLEEWRTIYLPIILDPVHDETYYYPWLYFVLSKGI
ncbi:hypothetical protein LOZ12_002726 [Ophidiomyces ophidiicola]|nr:hypothetical protein LOZ62_002371 [Ophidiomyces ophidiicola]KAI1958702.1 hypothetical protein LOZ59_003386 [Ophidiomyces ophidiicola]KAI1970201.1 hypothetical protein LOZ56_003862 [Ophidiomyces ophidiicola]KAI2006733.1 hypothetical protein LOZ50_002952 [Ophidiomyces ophidiicola]KAI2014379.1 hypothetical protein LOZ46_005563 [Ophidiomyces ophidiicola]